MALDESVQVNVGVVLLPTLVGARAVGESLAPTTVLPPFQPVTAPATVVPVSWVPSL